MLAILFIGSILGAALATSAQTVDLKGRVLDKVGNKPVPGALIKLVNSSLTATTDTAGRFTLKGSATALGGEGAAWEAAPYFRGGDLLVQAAGDSRTAHVEVFNLAGKRCGAAEFPLQEGWNTLRLPGSGRDYLDFIGYARIKVGREIWMKRILHASGRVHAEGEAALAGSLAKSAARETFAREASAGNLEVSADKLVKKTVPFAQDAADVGDIILDYPPRKLDVGATPIYGAYVLFDGSKGKAAAQAELQAKWKDWPRFTPSDIKFKLAKDPEFPNDTNRVTLQSCCNTVWGYDDIQALRVHGDAQIHVEWVGMGQYDTDENPDPGTGAGGTPSYINSGVYLQSRYEVQIKGWNTTPTSIPGNHDMGALVDDYAPTANANRANGKWQAYDITFRSARYNASGTRTENARISVWWNGVLVHDNRDARAPATGLGNHSGEEMNSTLYGLKLQSEGRDVRYRNIWIKDLNIEQPQTRFGY